jgi:hypothetical protein
LLRLSGDDGQNAPGCKGEARFVAGPFGLPATKLQLFHVPTARPSDLYGQLTNNSQQTAAMAVRPVTVTAM